MNKSDIISKIKEQAYENVNKKLEEEKKATEAKINEELDVVEEILKYIKNKLIFKELEETCLFKIKRQLERIESEAKKE